MEIKTQEWAFYIFLGAIYTVRPPNLQIALKNYEYVVITVSGTIFSEWVMTSEEIYNYS